MITGTHVVLRAPVKEDMATLLALRNDMELQMLLGVLPRANSAQRVDDWIASMMSDPRNIFFVIAKRDDEQALGYVQLTQLDFVHGFGELGICIGAHTHGKGYAAEAMHLLESYAHNVFNLRKIILRVLASNNRAIAFYKKVGYETVGVYKRHLYQNQTYHDTVIMEKFLSLSGVAPGDES